MTPYFETDAGIIYQGHVLEVLNGMEVESVHCVVTSPPYWGLRDYNLPPQIWGGDSACEHVWGDNHFERKRGSIGDKGTYTGGSETQNHQGVGINQGQFCQRCNAWGGSFGLEPTPELYIEHTVEIFRGVWRVLRKDGTVWLNLGDSYVNHSQPGGGDPTIKNRNIGDSKYTPTRAPGLKPKDLCGIPWAVAFALRADGWWLRQDVIWSKLNPMPESVTDRCTKSHEYIFLLTKSPRYFYDADAIREENPRVNEQWPSGGKNKSQGANPKDRNDWGRIITQNPNGRNKRSVWNIATHPFPEAHFATFPPKLIEPCILAGTSEKGCCTECGSPWVRVVEKVVPELRDVKSDYPGEHTLATRKYKHGEPGTESKTIGWEPTCECFGPPLGVAEFHIGKKPIPCTVLDIFGGSMTTAIVAYKHNRKFVMIELSETYIKDIGIPRIEKETRQMRLWN